MEKKIHVSDNILNNQSFFFLAFGCVTNAEINII